MEEFMIKATAYVQAMLDEQEALDKIYAAYDAHEWPTAEDNKRFRDAVQNRKNAHAELVNSLRIHEQNVSHTIMKTHKVARAMRPDWHAMNGGY